MCFRQKMWTVEASVTDGLRDFYSTCLDSSVETKVQPTMTVQVGEK
jgi:hypothetical protein